VNIFRKMSSNEDPEEESQLPVTAKDSYEILFPMRWKWRRRPAILFSPINLRTVVLVLISCLISNSFAQSNSDSIDNERIQVS
jgi:hypothetical protein